MSKNYVGKIGYCDNKVLGIRDKNGKILKGGHYVYIREQNGSKCKVNTFQSLESSNGNLKLGKIQNVRKGYLYAIPKGDADFPLWTGISINGIKKDIDLSQIKSVGRIKMKRRHKMFVGKFFK